MVHIVSQKLLICSPGLSVLLICKECTSSHVQCCFGLPLCYWIPFCHYNDLDLDMCPIRYYEMIIGVCKIAQTLLNHDVDTEWYTHAVSSHCCILFWMKTYICKKGYFLDIMYPSPWLLVYHNNQLIKNCFSK